MYFIYVTVSLVLNNIGFNLLCQDVLFGTEFALLGHNPIFYVITQKVKK